MKDVIRSEKNIEKERELLEENRDKITLADIIKTLSLKNLNNKYI